MIRYTGCRSIQAYTACSTASCIRMSRAMQRTLKALCRSAGRDVPNGTRLLGTEARGAGGLAGGAGEEGAVRMPGRR